MIPEHVLPNQFETCMLIERTRVKEVRGYDRNFSAIHGIKLRCGTPSFLRIFNALCSRCGGLARSWETRARGAAIVSIIVVILGLQSPPH